MVGHADLAEIVQRRGNEQEFDVLLRQYGLVVTGAPQLFRDCLDVVLGPLEMGTGLGITRLRNRRHGFHRDLPSVLEAFEPYEGMPFSIADRATEKRTKSVTVTRIGAPGDTNRPAKPNSEAAVSSRTAPTKALPASVRRAAPAVMNTADMTAPVTRHATKIAVRAQPGPYKMVGGDSSASTACSFTPGN